MTEREDKIPAAPSGAAEEQEILLDSPIVESEDGPGAVDAPGVSGSESRAGRRIRPRGRRSRRAGSSG